MDEEIKKILDNHEERISNLEDRPKIKTPKNNFSFKNKGTDHSTLLSELLSSEYCHKNNGLTYNEVLDIFEKNSRPVTPKKIRDLLSQWARRKKCETRKKGSLVSYFII